MGFELGTLGDYIKVQGGFAYKSKDFQDSGANKVLKIKNVRFGHVDYGDTAYISDTLAKETQAWSTNEGDILISMTGSGPNAPQSLVGRVARVWENEDKAWINQRVGRIVLRKENTIHPDFVYYLLSQRSSQDFLVSNSSGSANQANISGKTIEMLPCPIVSFEESSRIASTLIALDKKILLNRQINQTLEQMAQTLFKSWFVDFDPVMDNALDAGNPIPDELQHRAEARKAVRESEGFKPLPDNVRQLFPDAFEESELGWVPKGWEVTMLGDMCVELRRGISPKYIEEGGIKVINQKCIRNHEVNYDLARRNNPELRKVDGREVQLGDVLVNSTGVGTLGRMAQVTYIPEPTVVDSHVTLVRVNSDICPMYTFGQLLLSIENRVERLGEGSTGQTELSRKILSEQQVVLPPLTIANHIEATFKSFADKKVASRNEVDSLTKLRDTLLPKLISGELRLDDIELAVE
ncbi:restriction endonuclease subunit S [Vibrio metoecus]|uniref:restriction endonuclease subunit S n=1 Tax=Vibrio metoecus TaxID=1481663 RepID=UPI00272A9C7B|nr:restriction endonuclease subunit S [Vibrio metoecus]WKY92586.1 restriction endonuclease subunit S [Vibrio metoecus]